MEGLPMQMLYTVDLGKKMVMKCEASFGPTEYSEK